MRPATFVHSQINRTRYSQLFVPLLRGKRQFSTPGVLTPLENAWQPRIPHSIQYCLARLENEWTQRQPLKGRKVLLNMHLTGITLKVIDIMRKTASVEVTVSPELVKHDNAQQALMAAGIPFLTEIPEHKKTGYYDIIYDCGAGMRRLIPRLGRIELTQTRPEWYENMNFPVITVDNSLTKSIETGLGTGDSLVRLINQLARQSMTTLMGQAALPGAKPDVPHFPILFSMLNAAQLFSSHQFMIFGYGKVGRGIVNALESAGTPRENIFIVEASAEAYLHTMKNGYQGLLLNKESGSHDTVKKIQSLLPQIWAVITATGQAGAVSRHFSQGDYDPVPLLINMGTFDEFGVNFSPGRILNRKKPANFMLEYPTEVIYLDPIFSLFLQGGEELLINPDLSKGLNNISARRDHAVLNDWLAHHGGDIWRHRQDQKETENLIRNLYRNSIFFSKPGSESLSAGPEKLRPVSLLSH